jgi:hypothetical protein
VSPRLATSFQGLALEWAPLINVRLEFNQLLGLFRNATFRQQFRGYQGRQIPVRTHYFTWHGRPNSLLSYLLRDAIIGLESAVCSGVWTVASSRGALTDAVRDATQNPFSLKGYRGTAACVYRGLPSLIDPALALDVHNEALWKRISTFYQEVRNPLFHAYELASDDPDPALAALEVVWEGYQWLNRWFVIPDLMAGPIQWAEGFAERLSTVPEVSDAQINQFVLQYALPAEYRADPEHLPSNLDLLSVASVEGIYVPPSELVQLSLTAESGRHLQVELSPNSAMRLLLFLAHAQQHRGWAIPDRL